MATGQPQAGVRRRRTQPNAPDGGRTQRQAQDPAEPNAVTTPENQPAAPQPHEAFRQAIMRFALMFAFYHYYIKPKAASMAPVEEEVLTTSSVTASPAPNPFALLGINSGTGPPYYKAKLSAHWPQRIPLQLRLFISTNPDLTFHDAIRKPVSDAAWVLDDLRLSADQENYIEKNISLPVPAQVHSANSSWFAHVFVVRGSLWDISPEAVTNELVRENVLYAKHDIITWRFIDDSKKGKHLLSDGSAEEVEEHRSERADGEIDSAASDGEVPSERYEQQWKPTLPIVLIVSSSDLVLAQLPPTCSSAFRVSLPDRSYFPPMHVEEFWMLRGSLPTMNETVTDINLSLSFSPISLLKWSLYRQFDNVWEKQVEFGAMRKDEIDELKRMFVETNPVLLGTTMLVSMAHTILEALAFKNDISHWKNIKSMEGVSVRSMMWRIVMEFIIFLYLWDNETSWMIILGNGVGIVIEAWKFCKAVKFENFGKGRLLGFIPWFEVNDRESYSKKTKEYDEQAMRYMSYTIYPLITVYALYSLKYDTHKSWYSWIIGSLVGAVYAFGFIMMFPQIFINYKLKSVAHMPMKAMTYKTLNTIIDDLFSFIIKMPWLHRVACFRDDVVFLVILYQRWIYPVDKTRVNEFGQCFDEDGNEILKTGQEEASNGAPGSSEVVSDPAGKGEPTAEKDMKCATEISAQANGAPGSSEVASDLGDEVETKVQKDMKFATAISAQATDEQSESSVKTETEKKND